MNCKEGDLAVRIKAPEGYTGGINVGAIVKVIEYYGNGYMVTSINNVTVSVFRKALWFVEYQGEVKNHEGRRMVLPDADLKPLRDTEGDDETLAWKEVPHAETNKCTTAETT